MRQTRRILPVTAGDISGAASALYELGGMTVIHDPSGCNSTYNTHDEIRWYDQKSLIYVSGLTDVDVINGDDDRLIAEVGRDPRLCGRFGQLRRQWPLAEGRPPVGQRP